MADMSIADKFLRDGRVKLLAARLGWSRRETMGALLDVFAAAYDRASDILSSDDIDTAAELAGFTDAMVSVDLAVHTTVGVRIRGATARVVPRKRRSSSGTAQSLRLMPKDWAPRPQEQAQARAAGIDCEKAAEHFRDHHTAKGSRFMDWNAAFRTWLRNATRFGGGPNGAGRRTPLDRQLERVAMLENEERRR